MKLSNTERETLICFNEAEPEAEIFTYNPALQKKLLQLCEVRPEKIRLTKKGEQGSMTFSLPKKWIKVVPSRIPTKAQLEVLERMNANRHKMNRQA